MYRGCADDKKWPKLDYSYNGCRHQYYAWWDETPVLWCFCDSNMCNTNITDISYQNGGSTYTQSSYGRKQYGSSQGHVKSDTTGYSQRHMNYESHQGGDSSNKGSNSNGYHMVTGVYRHGQPKVERPSGADQRYSQRQNYMLDYRYNLHGQTGQGDSMQGQNQRRQNQGQVDDTQGRGQDHGQTHNVQGGYRQQGQQNNIPSYGVRHHKPPSRAQSSSKQGHPTSNGRGDRVVMRPGENSFQDHTNAQVDAEKALWEKLYQELVVGVADAAAGQNEAQTQTHIGGQGQADVHASQAAREGPSMGPARSGSLLKDLSATNPSDAYAVAYGTNHHGSAHIGNAHVGSGQPGAGYLGVVKTDMYQAGHARAGDNEIEYGQAGTIHTAGYIHSGGPGHAASGQVVVGSGHAGVGSGGIGVVGVGVGPGYAGVGTGHVGLGSAGYLGTGTEYTDMGTHHSGAGTSHVGAGVISGHSHAGSAVNVLGIHDHGPNAQGVSYFHNGKGYDAYGRLILLPSPSRETNSNGMGGTNQPGGQTDSGDPNTGDGGANTGHDMLGQGMYTKQPDYMTTGMGPRITIRPITPTPSPSAPDAKSGKDPNDIDSPVCTHLYIHLLCLLNN